MQFTLFGVSQETAARNQNTLSRKRKLLHVQAVRRYRMRRNDATPEQALGMIVEALGKYGEVSQSVLSSKINLRKQALVPALSLGIEKGLLRFREAYNHPKGGGRLGRFWSLA